MSIRRAKVAAGATVIGLAALGGVAMGTNQGLPASSQSAGAESASVVTGASSTATPSAGQPIALREGAESRAPIVTRASGGASSTPLDD
jgi:hypothetical protein